MTPSVAALCVAAIALTGTIGAAWISSRASTKTTVQAAVTKTLEQVWEQRVLFRDEQIAELRQELAEQAAASSKQIEKLSGEVQRLTDLVVELGGVPHVK